MREIIGNIGLSTARLAAFREKPPRGGSPARLRRSIADKNSWVGDRALREGRVLGDEARLEVKSPKSGRIIKI